jgi:archaemetzincin
VRLEITPLGRVDPAVLADLADGLPRYLPVRPIITSGYPFPGGSSGEVLDALLESGGGAGWRLGITEVPLTAANGREVIGEAEVGGDGAVISLARLRETAGWRLRDRLLTTALHEIGHLAGAAHCADPDCIMFPSAALRDTDRKGPGGCPPCERRIHAFFADRA